MSDANDTELRTLEDSLAAMPGMHECVARSRRTLDGETRAVAYVVSAAAPLPSRLRAHCEKSGARLPPDDVVRVRSLPLLESGAIDEAALASLPVIDAELECRAAGTSRAVRSWIASEPKSRLVAKPNGTSIDGKAPVRSGECRPPAILRGSELHEAHDAPRLLADLLRTAVARHGDRALTCVDADRTEAITYRNLELRALQRLAAMRGRGLVAGAHVVLLFDRNADFLVAFWACVLGGFVPVPFAVPAAGNVGGFAARMANVAGLLDEPVVLLSQDVEDRLIAEWPATGVARGRRWTLESLARESGFVAVHVAGPDDLALMLLTSGSTGKPKAVQHTHRSLLSACHAIAQRQALGDADVVLNWISMEHVGGLVMCHLTFVALGCVQVQVRPELLMQHPLRWLELLSTHRATFTWAPNFVFALVNEREAELSQRAFDLSALRCIVNGGEAVVARTAQRFVELLSSHGLRASAMQPAWGMSETASAATFSSSFRADAAGAVCVGPPNPGFDIRLVDERGAVVPTGARGQLQVRGPNVTTGYFRNPAANREAFTDDGWFRTGDLGELGDDGLCIVGREKSVIIVNGVNYYAHEIEAAIADVPGVVPDLVAAFAVRDPRSETDALAVAFHCRNSEVDQPTLATAIRAACLASAGIAPRFLLPVAAADIPKTDIGKIQHAQLRRRFESGGFAAMLAGETSSCASEQGRVHLPVWIPRRVMRGQGPAVVVLCGARSDLRAALAVALQSAGIAPLCVDAPAEAAAALASGSVTAPRAIVWCPTFGAPLQAASQVADLARTLARNEALAPTLRLLCVQEAAASGDASASASRSALAALLSVLGSEHGIGRVRTVTIAGVDAARAVVDELFDSARDEQVSHRAEGRFVRRLRLHELPAASPVALGVRTLHVLLGGTGGIGQRMAEHLLRASHRVLIIGRRSRSDFTSEETARFAALAAAGDLRYAAVDLHDGPGVVDAVRSVATEWHATPTIYHLAGTYEPRALLDESDATLRSSTVAKLAGIDALDALVEAYPHATFVGFSSVNALVGAQGTGAYSFANACLDGWATSRRERGVRAYSIAWSQWRGTGMSARHANEEAARHRGLKALDPRAAMQLLDALLESSEAANVVVGLDHEHPAIAMSTDDGAAPECLHLFEPAASGKTPASFVLTDRYGHDVQCVPKVESRAATSIPVEHGTTIRTALHDTIAGICREVLRLEDVDLHENFFELGASSVTVAQLARRLQDRLDRAVALTDLYAFPTVDLLAGHLARLDASKDGADDEDALRGAERRQRRARRRSAAP